MIKNKHIFKYIANGFMLSSLLLGSFFYSFNEVFAEKSNSSNPVEKQMPIVSVVDGPPYN